MREPCFDPADCARVAALPATDPLRAHARECPRCRALMDAYAAFLEADPGAVPAHELADATSRLSRALAVAAGAAARAGGGDSPPRSLWDRLAHPALRPAWGVATVALLAVAFVLWPRPAGRDSTVVLRGDAAPASVPVIDQGAWSADALVLTWRPVAGADAYELRFFSTALAEVGRTGPYHEASLVLALPSLSFRSAFGDSVVVRVVALHDGEAVGTSDARLLVRAAPAR